MWNSGWRINERFVSHIPKIMSQKLRIRMDLTNVWRQEAVEFEVKL
jgi:hypothetical protein